MMQPPPKPDPPPPKRPRALTRTSFSSLKQYLWCPEQWRRKRLLGHTELPGWAMVGGKAVHLVTERYDLYGLGLYQAAGWSWYQQFELAFEELIAEELQATGVPTEDWRVSGRASTRWPDKETEAFWRAEGPAFAKSYGDWRADNPGYQVWVAPDGQLGIELELLVDFDGDPLLCFIDRVFTIGNRLIVVDLKSGRTMPETTEQLLMYATCIELSYGRRPELGGYFDNRKGRLVHPEDMSVLSANDSIEQVKLFLGQAREGEFLARPGRHCTFCAYAPTCQWAKTLTFGLRPKEAA